MDIHPLFAVFVLPLAVFPGLSALFLFPCSQRNGWHLVRLPVRLRRRQAANHNASRVPPMAAGIHPRGGFVRPHGRRAHDPRRETAAPFLRATRTYGRGVRGKRKLAIPF